MKLKKKTIYLVVGETGEHADRTEWLVAAYLSKKRAETHAKRAEERAREIEKKGNSLGRPCERSEFDPNLRIDYTGTNYRIESVPLHYK